jgi:hypothetical protein
MGPFSHLRRGISVAYQNIGISMVFCLISLFSASASVGFILPVTESWAALFMASVLAGRKADWDTFQAVLNRRTIDVLVFGLINFVLLGAIGTLAAFMAIGLAFGLPLALGSSVASPSTDSLLHSLGTNIGFVVLGIVLLFLLILFFISLYCFLRLSFTPYVLFRTDLSFNDAIRESWNLTGDYGVPRIFITLLFAWILGSIGFLICGVGALFTWPVVYGALGSLFYDAYGPGPTSPQSTNGQGAEGGMPE